MFTKGFFSLFQGKRSKKNKFLINDAEKVPLEVNSKESFETNTTTQMTLMDDRRPSTLQGPGGVLISRIDSLLGAPPKHQISRNLHDLLDNNREWSMQKRRYDPDYFKRLSSVQQQPHYLWIGCSDSRVPANQIVNMPPGEIFVHRNVANIVNETDKNALAVIQYAVENLKVKHIIVCGHTCCGGVRACLGPKLPDPLEEWLCPIRKLREDHAEQLEALPDEDTRWRYLCEQNVRTQVEVLRNLPIVRAAWENKQPLAVHGWLYSMDEGLLRDLELTVDGGSFPISPPVARSRQISQVDAIPEERTPQLPKQSEDVNADQDLSLPQSVTDQVLQQNIAAAEASG